MTKHTGKKDTGIVKLKGGYPIAEELRDSLQKRDWSHAPTIASKDKDPSTWTTQECIDFKFNGIRLNQLSQYVEFWILGHKEGQIHRMDCTPEKFASMHEEIFATNGTLLVMDEHWSQKIKGEA